MLKIVSTSRNPGQATGSISFLIEVNGKLISMSMLWGFFAAFIMPDRQVIDRVLHMPGIFFP